MILKSFRYFCSLVILLMQWVAYARYAFKLHANISIVLVFGTIFLVNSFLIYFFIGPLGKEGLIYLTLITILILILSLIYFLVKIDMNKNIESLNISNSAAVVFHHLNYLKNKKNN